MVLGLGDFVDLEQRAEAEAEAEAGAGGIGGRGPHIGGVRASPRKDNLLQSEIHSC